MKSTVSAVVISSLISSTIAYAVATKSAARYVENNPEAIVESVQKWQQGASERKVADASKVIKKEHDAIYNAKHDPVAGKSDASVTVVEFYDYNCPACKMQFGALNDLLAKDKDVRVIFKEMPIFGPQSDANARIGLAVAALEPEKYIAFHEKMMTFEGRASEKEAFGFAKALGLSEAEIKAEIEKPYINEKIKATHALADKIGVTGTPAIVIGDTLTPHAMDVASLEAALAEARK